MRLAAISLLAAPSLAAAAEAGKGIFIPLGIYTVDRFDDDILIHDCLDTVPDDCTLRGAIFRANLDGEGSTIKLPPGYYPLTVPGPEEDDNLSGDLDLTGEALNLVVTPAGGSALIEQLVVDRVFDVHQGSGLFRIIGDLTLRGGIAAQADGLGRGGVLRASQSGGLDLVGVRFEDGFAAASGGCLHWQSPAEAVPLVLEDVSFEGCVTQGEGGAFSVFVGSAVGQLERVVSRGNFAAVAGGGGYVVGSATTLVIEASAFEHNLAASQVDPSHGGGLAIEGGSVSIRGSTFAGNRAGGLGPQAEGGGIALRGGLTLIRNSTLSQNSVGTTTMDGTELAADGLAAARLEFVTVEPGLEVPQRTLVIRPGSNLEIFASIVRGECSGAGGFVSMGFNVERRVAEATPTQCGLNHVSDVPTTAPLLKPLAGYGGPTPTHMLDPDTGSTAFLVSSTVCADTDQRGALRSGLFCYSGAVEVGAFAPGPWIFSDGFESATTEAWSITSP